MAVVSVQSLGLLFEITDIAFIPAALAQAADLLAQTAQLLELGDDGGVNKAVDRITHGSCGTEEKAFGELV